MYYLPKSVAQNYAASGGVRSNPYNRMAGVQYKDLGGDEGVGEIHDVFEAKGAQMFGYTDASEAAGYFHEESKTQRGDKFVGLVCDNANQDDMTDGRVAAWCAQLRSEGFLTGGSVVAPEPVAQVEAAPEASKIEKKNVAVAVEELASVAGPPEVIFEHDVEYIVT